MKRAFVFSLFAFLFTVAFASAQTITWKNPTNDFLFWKFIDGYVKFYNIKYLDVKKLQIPNDADVILAYTSQKDVQDLKHDGVPLIVLGKWYWFKPSFVYAYNLLSKHAFHRVLDLKLGIFPNITYKSKGINTPPKNIVILYKSHLCKYRPWWHWWKPCVNKTQKGYKLKLFYPLFKKEPTVKNLSVKYRVNIYKDGRALKSGEKINQGKVLLKFENQNDNDILWYAPKIWYYTLVYVRIRYNWHMWNVLFDRHLVWQFLGGRKNKGMWIAPGELPNAKCREEDLLVIRPLWRIYHGLFDNITHFVTIAVYKPTKHIEGIENLNCQQTQEGWECDLTPGTHKISFVFSTTTLRAYHSYMRPKWRFWYGWYDWNKCLGVNSPLYEKITEQNTCLKDDDCDDYEYDKKHAFEYKKEIHDKEAEFRVYERTIPEQKISYTLYVQPQNNPPESPDISVSEYGKVGESVNATFSTSDTENDPVYFEIQWEENGEIERYPQTGFVSSQNTYSLSHVYTSSGEKQIKIRAKDGKGESLWKQTSTIIYDPATISFSANQYLIPKNTSAILSWDSKNATYCSASGGWSGIKPLAGSERTQNLTEFKNTFALECGNPASSSTAEFDIYTYACGDGICTTGVEDCNSCQSDCGLCSVPKDKWDVLFDMTSNPIQIRYGVDPDEVDVNQQN